MPNQLTELPEELNLTIVPTTETSEITNDPFSETFLEESNKISAQEIDVSTFKAAKKAKVKRVPFVMATVLKNRLKNLLAKTGISEDAKLITNALLSLKRVDPSTINYLGFSKADYSKISYMDEKRIATYKEQYVDKLYITAQTVAVEVDRCFSYHQSSSLSENSEPEIFRRTLKLGKNRIPVPLEIVKIEEVKKVVPLHFNYYEYNTSERKTFSTLIRTDIPQYTVKGLQNNFNLTSNKFASGYVTRPDLESNKSILYTEGTHLKGFRHIEFENLKEVRESEVWNPDKRYHTSVGKIIRKIFKDGFSDRQITAFAEAYARLVVVADNTKTFNIVSGEEIKFWYHEHNNVRSGTLGNSCMRYEYCGNFFKIYTENPECKMAILVDKRTNKLVARALIWKDKFFDRIYYSNDNAHNILKKQLEELELVSCYGTSQEVRIDIPYETFKSYGPYPYMDSLYLYNFDTQQLGTNGNLGESPGYNMRRTGGSIDIHRYAPSFKYTDGYNYRTDNNDNDNDGVIEDTYECAICSSETGEIYSALGEDGYNHDCCEECVVEANSNFYNEAYLVGEDSVSDDLADYGSYILRSDAITYRNPENPRQGSIYYTHEDNPDVRLFIDGNHYDISDLTEGVDFQETGDGAFGFIGEYAELHPNASALPEVEETPIENEVIAEANTEANTEVTEVTEPLEEAVESTQSENIVAPQTTSEDNYIGSAYYSTFNELTSNTSSVVAEYSSTSGFVYNYNTWDTSLINQVLQDYFQNIFDENRELLPIVPILPPENDENVQNSEDNDDIIGNDIEFIV